MIFLTFRVQTLLLLWLHLQMELVKNRPIRSLKFGWQKESLRFSFDERSFVKKIKATGRGELEKPDLIIIDGGKGQLSSVMKIVGELGIEGIDFVSLAKKHEEVFLPNLSKPVLLPKNSSALFLFQRIRDEAHRFAVTYHKKLRSKAMTKTNA